MICNYLAYEGIDGSGKSSLIKGLSEVLSNQQVENKIVREPGGTKVGEGVRELLLSHDSVSYTHLTLPTKRIV